MQDNDWKDLINGLDIPTEGTEAPDMEKIPKEQIKDGESPVTLQKIVTEVYIYTSTANPNDMWFGSQTLQDVQVLGQMRLSEALKIIQSAKNRRRRRKN